MTTEKDFDMQIAHELGVAFSEKAEELNATWQTILLASMRILTSILKRITIPDENGKKYPRIREMIVPMMDAFNADYPIDREE